MSPPSTAVPNLPRDVLAGCTPRVYPRPAYPSAGHLVWDFFTHHTRAPALLVGFTMLLHPLYQRGVQHLTEGGWTEQQMFVIFAIIAHTLPYIVVNGAYGLCDHFQWFQQYKVDRQPAHKYSWQLFWKTMIEAALGQVVTGPLVVYYAYDHFIAGRFRDHATPVLAGEGYEPHVMLFGAFAFAKFWNSVLFYFAHRILHHKELYPYIHKQHHTYNGSTSFCAEYAHPIEQIFANIIPTFGGILLAADHCLPLYVWFAYRLFQTYEAHSGYAFYDSFAYQKLGLTHTEAALFHDFHHADNTGNFGDLWLDGLFGTCDPWLARGGFEGYWLRNHGDAKAKKVA